MLNEVKHLDDLDDEMLRVIACEVVATTLNIVLAEPKLVGKAIVPEIAAILGWHDELVQECVEGIRNHYRSLMSVNLTFQR